MNEVSRRAAMWPYDVGKALDLDDDQIFANSGIDAQRLKESKRIGWDSYVALVENIHTHVGADGMRKMGREYAFKDEFRGIRRMAGLIASPRALYHFLARWAGPANNSNIRFTMEDEPAGTILHTCAIEDGFRDCPDFLYGATGALEVMPCMLGLPSARIEELEIEERFGAYRIHVPDSRTLTARTGRMLRRFVGMAAVPSVLIEQSREIAEQSGTLTRQHEDFRTVVDGMSKCVFVLDGTQLLQLLYANRSCRTVLGIPDATPLPLIRIDHCVAAGSIATWDRLLAATHSRQNAVERFEIEFCCEKISGEEKKNAEMESEAIPPDRILLSFDAPRTILFGEREGVLLAGRDVTAERQLDEQMRSAAYEERRRLAMELHDGLGQQLTGIAWQASILSNELGKNGGRSTAGFATAETLASMARESIHTARDLAHGLAIQDVAPDNLRRALLRLQDETTAMAAIKCSLSLPEESITTTAASLVEMINILKEAATNAVKHARCREFAISLEPSEHGWYLTAVNDGQSVDPKRLETRSRSGVGSLGLQSMKLRAHRLGGELQFEPLPNGLRLMVSLPTSAISTERSAENESAALQKNASTFKPVVLSAAAKVLVADDHDLVRAGLVNLLNASQGIDVVGYS
ncbi:MAG: signal transduction histidine kinase [Verrucomicrobiales bacterium]|jgi:signal transduction histidine kinase